MSFPPSYTASTSPSCPGELSPLYTASTGASYFEEEPPSYLGGVSPNLHTHKNGAISMELEVSNLLTRFTTGDPLNGTLTLLTSSKVVIPFRRLLVSLIGTYNCHTKGAQPWRFLLMVETPKGLPLDGLLAPKESYTLPFSFRFPDFLPNTETDDVYAMPASTKSRPFSIEYRLEAQLVVQTLRFGVHIGADATQAVRFRPLVSFAKIPLPSLSQFLNSVSETLQPWETTRYAQRVCRAPLSYRKPTASATQAVTVRGDLDTTTNILTLIVTPSTLPVKSVSVELFLVEMHSSHPLLFGLSNEMLNQDFELVKKLLLTLFPDHHARLQHVAPMRLSQTKLKCLKIIWVPTPEGALVFLPTILEKPSLMQLSRVIQQFALCVKLELGRLGRGSVMVSL